MSGDVPVVGIGASAGGLAAFEAFFSAMPDDDDVGMAFVLVQHLSPDHKSILRDLVARTTNMEVFEVEDGMEVRAGCAYIIPPNHDMSLVSGALQLLERTGTHGPRLPIDFFFRSLAEDQGARATGIVLAGTGSDGTLGLRAINGAGGMTMAQEPSSTDFDGMPRSAIATGLVDFVMRPEEMGPKLLALAAHGFERGHESADAIGRGAPEGLDRICTLLRSHAGHDFSEYKPNSLARRVERRMAVHKITEMSDYIRFAQQTPDEVDGLFHDLLIGVTSFFRDPDAFTALEEKVVPQTVDRLPVEQAATQIRTVPPARPARRPTPSPSPSSSTSRPTRPAPASRSSLPTSTPAPSPTPAPASTPQASPTTSPPSASSASSSRTRASTPTASRSASATSSSSPNRTSSETRPSPGSTSSAAEISSSI